jgi:hypothetical protein
MYVYDCKLKVFVWFNKIPEQEPITNENDSSNKILKVPNSKKETKEIKSILKTSGNKTTTVQIVTPPIQPIQRWVQYTDDQIYKIGKKNVHDVKKFIHKHKLKDSFLHFSLKSIEKLDSVILDNSQKSGTNKSVYSNPSGLWLSHGSGWLDYVELNIKKPSPWNLFPYTYKIEVFDSIKLITSKDDLFKFIKTYKRKPGDIKFYDVIDWDRVRKDWDGLIITPWLGEKIWHNTSTPSDRFEIVGGESAHDFINEIMGARWKNNNVVLSEWYRHWECASGVIWNVQGIASCNLIKETDFSKYI